MNKEFRIPKEKWGPGPWQHEPDREEFEHGGFPCLALRGPLGAWCGYVAVLPGHPFYGKSYDDVDVDVHGGLTYSRHCQGEICHKPKPGEPDDVYWFGFDCSHVWDLMPGFRAMEADLGIPPLPPNDWTEEVYRDLDYVKSEIRRLADQLASVH